jgi:SAM-dependent methyltransferase
VIKDGIKRLVNRVRDLVEPPLRHAQGIDYATYRRIQNEGFQRKIDVVFVKQANVEHICRFALSRGPLACVLCHGTRNGAEQRFFKSALPAARVLGTEIGDGASRFPDTIEWDFHDMRPEWEGAWDLIYSNSWDHALDPERAFRTWARCLSPAGLLVLEHTEFHTVRHSSDLDPFGASFKGLAAYLDKVLAPAHRVAATITDMPDAPNGQRAVVVARA